MFIISSCKNYADNFGVETFNILNYLLPPHDKSKLQNYEHQFFLNVRIWSSTPELCISLWVPTSTVDPQYVSIAICAQVPWISIVLSTSLYSTMTIDLKSISIHLCAQVLRISLFTTQACTVYLSTYISLCDQVPYIYLSHSQCSSNVHLSFLPLIAQVPYLYLPP